MTYFDPTPSELVFRIAVSLAGLVMMMFAISLRGMPTDPVHTGLGLAAIAFLAFSAVLSGLKLRNLRDD